MFDELFIIMGVIIVLIASFFDIKMREIPDWLNFSLIAIGFSFNALLSILNKNPRFLIYSLIGFLAMFLLGSLLYYTKQWGGGDAKLLMGLGALFPTFQGNKLFLISLLINILFVGAIYGLLFVIYFGIKNSHKIIKKIKKDFNKSHSINLSIILMALIIISLIFEKIRFITLLFIILLAIYFILIPFIRIIEEVSMFKKIKVSKLTEGDWIINNIYHKGKLIYNKNSPGVNKRQIDLLKKLKNKSVMVKEGIPFMPAIAIALILTLLFGNFILNLFMGLSLPL